MPRKKLEPDAALRARAKRLYDRGASIRDLAPMLGMGWRTLYKRVDEWGWVRRAEAPPSSAAERDEDALLPPPGEKIPDWLEDAAATAELEALERNARRLAAVAKSLAALDKLAARSERESAPEKDDDLGEADAMRAELLRRLEVLAGRPPS